MKQQLLYKKIVVKVGTNVITGKNGELDLEILSSLTNQIATLQKQGIQVILVSSGAVGAGRSLVKLSGTIAPVAAPMAASDAPGMKLRTM